jgi:hypothetical protein
LGFALGHLGKGKPQVIELASNGSGRGQLSIAIALVQQQLLANCFRCPARGEPLRTETRIGLTLGLHDVSNSMQQVGQAFFSPKASSTGKRLTTSDAALDFVHAFADGGAVPTAFRFGLSLPTRSQRQDGASPKLPSLCPAQGFRRFDPGAAERLNNFHFNDLRNVLPRRSFYAFLGHLFLSESLKSAPGSNGRRPW